MRVDELIFITIGKTDVYASGAKDALTSLSSLNPGGEQSLPRIRFRIVRSRPESPRRC